jgi:hypothetical protein
MRRRGHHRHPEPRKITPVRLGPRDLTMFAHASELYEVLRYAQDDGDKSSRVNSMRGGALVDGAVLRHLMIFHQAEAPIDQRLFVFVG